MQNRHHHNCKTYDYNGKLVHDNINLLYIYITKDMTKLEYTSASGYFGYLLKKGVKK